MAFDRQDEVLACLDELRALVKLLPPADPAARALDLGLAVCAGLARERLSPALVRQFILLLCDALAAGGAEISIGLALPGPPRLLYA